MSCLFNYFSHIILFKDIKDKIKCIWFVVKFYQVANYNLEADKFK